MSGLRLLIHATMLGAMLLGVFLGVAIYRLLGG